MTWIVQSLIYLALMALVDGTGAGCHQCCHHSHQPSNPSEPIGTAVDIFTAAQTYKTSALSCPSVATRARPFTTAAFAQTLDGSISPTDKQRFDISCDASFRLLHSLRGAHDAVLIGSSTMEVDRPRLTVRSPLPGAAAHPASPMPVVLDSSLRILSTEDVLLDKPIVFTCVAPSDSRFRDAQSRLSKVGGQLITCPADSTGRCDLDYCLEALKRDYAVQSLLVEGGAQVLTSFLEKRLLDQVVVTVRPALLGGYRSMTHQLDQQVDLKCLKVSFEEGCLILHGTCNGKHH